MEYRIIIDSRENDQMIDQISTQSHLSGWLGHHVTNNVTGDFVFIKVDHENNYTLAVFERKTWVDLAASIKDKRCETQIPRLEAFKHKNVLVYIVVEGLMPPHDGVTNGIANVCLYGMLDNLSAREFNIVHTRDEGMTASRIINICKHIVSQNRKIYNTCGEMYLDKLRTLPPELPDEMRTDILTLVEKYCGGDLEDKEVIDVSRTPIGVAVSMLRNITSEKIAKTILGIYSIKNVYDNPDIINGLKYSGGKKVSVAAINKIKSSIRLHDTVVLFLQSIKGVGNSARIFVDRIGSEEIMKMTEAPIIEHNGRKLNRKILPLFIEAINVGSST
jgi:ERCC4-type nuclease